ncbi:MAG: hypothetical protein QM570_07005 [Planctomycetota bacterium]|nr:hypothetical protein [Planctomycetota bacterium]
MARVETYRSRGTPSPVSGRQPVPWPHLMGASGRGQQQLGATIEGVSRALLADYVDDKTAEELSNLKVNMLKGLSGYNTWTQTNLDNPDIDGAVFKEHAERWKEELIPNLSTGISRQQGQQMFNEFVAQQGVAARERAVNQQRANAHAAYISNMDWMQTLEDRPYDPSEIEEHMLSIADAVDVAARDGLIPNDPATVLTEIRKAGKKLYESAVLNAMKHKPEQVETLLSDPNNFLQPEDEKRLRGTWAAEQNALRNAKEKAYAAQLEANDRTATALTLRTARGAAEPGQEMTPAAIEQAMLDGQISETTGRMLWDRLVKPKEIDPAVRLQSYGAMSRVTARLKRGEITPEYWKKVYQAHFDKLAEEDAEMFLDRAHAADPYDQPRSQAEKMAAEALAPLFDEDLYPAEEGEAVEMDRDEAVGTVLRRMEAFVQAEEAQGRTVDPAKYRDQAREIIREVYREEYERQNMPPEPKKRPKSKAGYSIGMTVTGKDGQQYVVVKFDESGNPLFRKK